MTQYLPHVPALPHDPRSLLLNARLGFRALTPAPTELAAVVDPGLCALTLPELAGTARELTEASGSFGGLRPPANVAVAADGSILLLSRARLTLRRFDPCACAFVDVPCFGGYGGEPRQLRNPGGITIGCNNLYVCDTGLEHPSPDDPCAPLEDSARLTRQNHRVSVFALKGFALRGHLAPPAAERPWLPVGVAVDPLGRVWVADALGRLHRFSPHGAWERAFATAGAAHHVAVDLRGRVYVVSIGATALVEVFEPSGARVSGVAARPEELRELFPRLPFSVGADGRFWLEPPCEPNTGAHSPTSTVQAFDETGTAVEVTPAIAYEHAATFRSGPLDSGIAGCVWHRIALSGRLPAGTQIEVRAFAADAVLTAAELDSFAAWVPCALAEKFDDETRWDCLLRATPGRYLWFELVLRGGGSATPAVESVLLEFPRVSLRRFLPAVFGSEPVGADFTDRFLALFDTPLRCIEREVDRMARLFDPRSAPAVPCAPGEPDFLSWLATWVGISTDRNWDVPTRRRFVERAGSLFDRRGTVQGLREELLLLLAFDRRAACPPASDGAGRCVAPPLNCAPAPAAAEYRPPPLVLEHFRLRRWLRIGKGRLGTDAVVWGERVVGRSHLGTNAQAGVTRLDTSPDPVRDPFLVHANRFSVFVPARCRDDDRLRRSLENLVKSESPAGTRGQLHFVEPRFRIGVQSMLGFDAVVAAVPRGVTLGEARLGAAATLTRPPHLEGGPSIALDERGHVGTTTVLT
jgi:phage tail-like protein